MNLYKSLFLMVLTLFVGACSSDKNESQELFNAHVSGLVNGKNLKISTKDKHASYVFKAKSISTNGNESVELYFPLRKSAEGLAIKLIIDEAHIGVNNARAYIVDFKYDATDEFVENIVSDNMFQRVSVTVNKFQSHFGQAKKLIIGGAFNGEFKLAKTGEIVKLENFNFYLEEIGLKLPSFDI